MSAAQKVLMAASMPSTGDELLKAFQLAQPLADGLAAGRRVGDPLARVAREHVDPLVVHDLQALHPGVGVEHLVHLLAHRRPGEALHAARGVDDEDDVLAVHRDAPDRRVGRPLVGLLLLLLLQALHLLAELLLRRQQAPGDDVLDLGQLLARGVPALDAREVALQARHLEPLLRDLLLAAPQVAVEDGRLAADRPRAPPRAGRGARRGPAAPARAPPAPPSC